MGNGNAFTLLAASLFATAAFGLLIGAGLSCSFLDIKAKDGDLLAILETSEQEALTSTSLGILCQGDFYDLESDSMWLYSRAFFFIAVCFGGVATLLSWAVTTFAPPVRPAWLGISGAAGLTAILQLPMFLMFETEPCADYSADQDCSQSTGSYLLISSTCCWIGVTLITQIFDPPDWATNLDQWRVTKDPRDDGSLSGRDMLADGGAQHSSSSTSEGSSGFLANICRWPHTKFWGGRAPLHSDDSLVEQEEGRGTMPLIRLAPIVAESDGSPKHFPSDELPSPVAKRFDDTFLTRNVVNDELPPPVLHDFGATLSTRQFPSDEMSPPSIKRVDDTQSAKVFPSDELAPSIQLRPKDKMEALKQNLDAARLSKERKQRLEQPQTPVFVTGDKFVQSTYGSSVSAKDEINHSMEEPPRAVANRSVTSYGMPVADEIYRSLEEDSPPVETSKALQDPTSQRTHEIPSVVTPDTTKSGSDSNSKDTLGSLASKEMGDDSILDKTTDTEENEHLTEKPDEYETPLLASNAQPQGKTVQKKVKVTKEKTSFQDKFLFGRNRVHRTLSYTRMDDDDGFDPSLPSSPPLEVVTINLESEDDFQLRGVGSAADDEQDLLDDWYMLHDNIVSPGIQKYPEKGSEPFLNFTIDADDSDDEESDGSDSVGRGDGVEMAVAPEETTQRIQENRSNNRRKQNTSRSVVSVSSLLDLTIEEETLADIKDEMDIDKDDSFDPYSTRPVLQRTRSAPNLPPMQRRPKASKPSDDSDVSSKQRPKPLEEFKTTAMNSYRVESWGRERSRSVSPASARSNPEMKEKKIPIFREERNVRAGIHAPEIITVDPNDDHVSTLSTVSLVSRKARQARLRRLAEARARSPHRLRRQDTPQSQQQLGSSGKIDDGRDDAGIVDVTAEDSGPDDTSMVLDKLDLDLVEIQRPDGAEYGPEEASL
jgi:hypothetical protein